MSVPDAEDEVREPVDKYAQQLIDSLLPGDMFSVIDTCFCRTRTRDAIEKPGKIGRGMTVERGSPIIFELADVPNRVFVGYVAAREGVCLVEVTFKKAGRI